MYQTLERRCINLLFSASISGLHRAEGLGALSNFHWGSTSFDVLHFYSRRLSQPACGMRVFSPTHSINVRNGAGILAAVSLRRAR
jgi:hypothetical protein